MAPMIEAAAPGPAESSGPKEANLIFTVAAKRATLTKTGLLLEGVSPVVSYVSDVPKKNAGELPLGFFPRQLHLQPAQQTCRWISRGFLPSLAFLSNVHKKDAAADFP